MTSDQHFFPEVRDVQQDEEEQRVSDESKTSFNGSLGFDTLLASMKSSASPEPETEVSLWTEMSKKVGKTSSSSTSSSSSLTLKQSTSKNSPIQRSIGVNDGNVINLRAVDVPSQQHSMIG